MAKARRPRYEIIESIASSPRGDLFRVRIPKEKGTYALRKIPVDLWRSKKTKNRFEDDCDVLINNPPPLSPKISACWTEEGQVGVLRSFVDGIPLSLVYANLVPLGADGIFGVLMQVITTLRDAHRLGVIHGAIRLSNLILGPDGKVWTTDFGVPIPSAIFKKNPHNNLLDIVSSLAPEQLSEQQEDERCDIFSLGVAMHSLGALDKPYVGATVAEVMEHILTRPPILLREESGVDDRLRGVVVKCMAMHPQDRYQTVDAIAREVSSGAFGHFDGLSAGRFQDIAVRCGLEGVFRSPASPKHHKPVHPPILPPVSAVEPAEVEARKPIPEPTVQPVPEPVIEPAPWVESEVVAEEEVLDVGDAERIPPPPEEPTPEEFVEKYVRAWNQKAFLVEYDCFKEGFLGVSSGDYVQRRMVIYLRLTRGGRDRVTQQVTRFPQVRKTPVSADVLCVRQIQFPRRTELYVDQYSLEKKDQSWKICGVKSTPTTEKELPRTIHMQIMLQSK